MTILPLDDFRSAYEGLPALAKARRLFLPARNTAGKVCPPVACAVVSRLRAGRPAAGEGQGSEAATTPYCDRCHTALHCMSHIFPAKMAQQIPLFTRANPY